jgi:hypothetical protein
MPRSGWFRVVELGLLLVVLHLPAACATSSAKSQGAKVVVVERDATLPKGCESLGPVSGRYSGTPRHPEYAWAFAVDEARDLGATHLLPDWDLTRQIGEFTYVVRGAAYRCGSSPPPAPAGTLPPR